MKALVTQQFNHSMSILNTTQQREVSKLFSVVSNMEKNEVVNSSFLTRIKSTEEEIYTLRGQHVRIFCTFDASDNIIFLDVTSVETNQFRGYVSQEGETTIFGKNGAPKAYIAWDDENTIYSFEGKPLAYVDEQNNVYGFNGRHLGWFEDGILWDHQGQRVGFIESTSPVFTQFEPFKGFKQFKPFKSMSNSAMNLLEFLEKGR